jgi:Amt family ammonium transporter
MVWSRVGRQLVGAAVAAAVGLTAEPASAQEAKTLSEGNAAWLLTATALVLFMTMPGLALFYGGLVRAKNVLSVLMQCVAIACVVSVLWVVVGYSLAFNDIQLGWIGGLGKAFLSGVETDSLNVDVPETVFVMFQMTFAIITPALIVGAYVERIRFPHVLLFSSLWLLFVYVPVAHWVWGGGFLMRWGTLDFAGGLVVHATAGVSALVVAKLLGGRKGFPRELTPPHSPGLTMIGAGMLWVGWYGFNAGSALAANGSAGMAMLVTHTSAAVAALTWIAIEWIKFGKPSLVGVVTGLVAGLATVTPASGYIGPIGGLLIGLAGGGVCYLAVGMVKTRLKIDDSLDVFAVHGVGGILGILLTAVFVSSTLGGAGLKEGASIGSQLWLQAVGGVIVVAWSAAATVVLVNVVRALVGFRVEPDEETEGLDLTAHGERGHNL